MPPNWQPSKRSCAPRAMKSRVFTRAGRSWAKSQPRTNVDGLMSPRRVQISQITYGAAVVAVFAWAAWLRIRAPFEPMADSDAWGYLSPAVSKLTGGAFTHAGRNFVYPGFLCLLLRGAGNFRAIAAVQHFLGLG